ncbi:MAG: basic secretory protein-like protein, partial [Bacteroidota bacterium]
MSALRVYIVFFLLVFSRVSFLEAQYFGKNKPSYRTFDFGMVRTSHFDIYHDLEDTTTVKYIGELAEQWYGFHRQILVDTFDTRNPLLLYRNHADFQQTNAIMGQIGVGTGGATEGLKRRVVMPVSFSRYQTAHVLGHELVHAFQYHIVEKSPELDRGAILRIPLWMTEGMAEYLSVGNIDAHTAIWMRDALLHDNFPSFKDINRGARFSPYRYGHAFWSYIVSRFGEQYIRRLYETTARQGYEEAMKDVLGTEPDSLLDAWKQTLRQELLSDRPQDSVLAGHRFLTDENAGRYNLAPSVSPDGQKLVFLSERDAYSIDLFLADAETGRVNSKIYSNTDYGDIDALDFMSLSGSWSPDNRFFAFTAYKKGRSVILVYDTEEESMHATIAPELVNAIASPAWSPGGEKLAFSGMKDGKSDLYCYHFADSTCKPVTRDRFARLQPSWGSEDNLWCVTDQPVPGQTSHFPGYFNISSVNLSSGKSEVFRTFDGARNLNPVEVNEKVFFLSNRDGYRNLYLLTPETGKIEQATNIQTGITGMTEMSPALSVSETDAYYSVLQGGEFQIIKTPVDTLLEGSVSVYPGKFQYRNARLSPWSEHFSVVDQNLIYNNLLDPPPVLMTKEEPRRGFELDYIGNMAGGVMTGRFGTGMAGSIEGLFSDIPGNNLLYGGLSINGKIYDFGGQVALLNQKRRIKVGGSLSHIPYRMGYYNYEEQDGDEELVFYRRRLFEDKGALFGYLPLNRSQRIEAGVSMAHYSYRYEKIKHISEYYPSFRPDGEEVESPGSFWGGKADIAYVFDNSQSGMASPVDGTRARMQFEHHFKGFNFQGVLLDYRRYKFVRPFSFAFRLYHYGRYGDDKNTTRMTPLFTGYSWLVRGYDTAGFFADSTQNNQALGIRHLVGNKLLVSNLEWRMPFSGPIDLAW